MGTILFFPRPSKIYSSLAARLRSPDIALDIINNALECYDLRLTQPPRNLPNARRNHNLVIDTQEGKKILKRYRPDWQVSTIVYEHSILNTLAALNFPAPRMVPTRQGETFIQMNGLTYSIFDFIDGTGYSMNFLLRNHRLQLMQYAGERLARLHQALDGFIPAGRHHLGFRSYTGGRWRDLSWHTAKVAQLVEKSQNLAVPEDKALAVRLVQTSPDFMEQMAQLDHLLAEQSLPRLIIHGDYGLHNIIFGHEGLVIPVDFELARLEWRLCDLVSCLSKLRTKDQSYDHQSITAMLEGYLKQYPLSELEWQAFPQVWKFYKLQKVVGYWSSYFETNGPIRKLESALAALEQSSWAMNNQNFLSELQRRMA